MTIDDQLNAREAKDKRKRTRRQRLRLMKRIHLNPLMSWSQRKGGSFAVEDQGWGIKQKVITRKRRVLTHAREGGFVDRGFMSLCCCFRGGTDARRDHERDKGTTKERAIGHWERRSGREEEIITRMPRVFRLNAFVRARAAAPRLDGTRREGQEEEEEE